MERFQKQITKNTSMKFTLMSPITPLKQNIQPNIFTMTTIMVWVYFIGTATLELFYMNQKRNTKRIIF